MITGKLVLFAPCAELVSRTTKTDVVAPPALRGVFFQTVGGIIALVLPMLFRKAGGSMLVPILCILKRGTPLLCMNQCEGSSSSEAESHSPQGRASTDQHWKH